LTCQIDQSDVFDYVSNETYSRDGPKNDILGQNFESYNQNDMPLPILVKTLTIFYKLSTEKDVLLPILIKYPSYDL
jgi:hypothetical protein